MSRGGGWLRLTGSPVVIEFLAAFKVVKPALNVGYEAYEGVRLEFSCIGMSQEGSSRLRVGWAALQVRWKPSICFSLCRSSCDSLQTSPLHYRCSAARSCSRR